jgi:antitoxin MazE
MIAYPERMEGRAISLCIDIVDTISLEMSHPRRVMKATIKKWGNSAAVRIPSSVLRAMHLDLDEVVEVREEAGRIVIEPIRQKTYKLDDLLKGISSKNLHSVVDFGAPEGKEAW